MKAVAIPSVQSTTSLGTTHQLSSGMHFSVEGLNMLDHKVVLHHAAGHHRPLTCQEEEGGGAPQTRDV